MMICKKCGKRGVYNLHESRRGYKIRSGKVIGKQCKYCHTRFKK